MAQSAVIFAEQQASGNPYQTFIMLAVALLFFYLILWRPEQKRRKKLTQMRESMKVGDQVTAMGIIGSIEEIKEQSLILKMIDGSKIEMLKAAITEVHPSSTEKTETPSEPEEGEKGANSTDEQSQ